MRDWDYPGLKVSAMIVSYSTSVHSVRGRLSRARNDKLHETHVAMCNVP